MTQTVRLVCKDGTLYLPLAAPDRFGHADALLMYHYPAGDVDTSSGPMQADTQHAYRLGVALFDAREMGQLPEGAFIELPDGAPFDFDAAAAQPCPFPSWSEF